VATRPLALWSRLLVAGLATRNGTSAHRPAGGTEVNDRVTVSEAIDRVGIVVNSVSPALARRIALAAQGMGRPAPASVGTRQLNGFMDRIATLQLDSVNVFERSHYLPAFARLGAYDKATLDRLIFGPRSAYTEYWAHVAAVIPMVDRPLFHHRMEFMRDKYLTGWSHENPGVVDWVLGELRDRGVVRASELEHPSGKGDGGWWGWSLVKLALERLWLAGDVVTAGRTRFERSYALAETGVPRDILNTVIDPVDAKRTLVAKAVKALGIGTVSDIKDYYRMRDDDTKLALADLVDAGTVERVTVAGWNQPAYLDVGARMPRRIESAALLSPFDPIVWERERNLRLFDFHYRIEIYTPEPKRIYGYYSLPVLVDDQIVGRIDLKNDRQNRVLRVQSAWREPHATPGVEQRIVPLLESVSAWQGHESVEFAGRGDLSAHLQAAWHAR